MKKKTYGVFGLMEFFPIISLGKRKFTVPFVNGITCGAGVTPASYSTDNPIIQLAIESSSYFKTGRIKIIKVVDIASPAEEQGAVRKSEAQKKTALKTVQVGSLVEAIDYLVENYNAKKSELRRKDSVIAFASANGIVFEGI